MVVTASCQDSNEHLSLTWQGRLQVQSISWIPLNNVSQARVLLNMHDDRETVKSTASEAIF